MIVYKLLDARGGPSTQQLDRAGHIRALSAQHAQKALQAGRGRGGQAWLGLGSGLGLGLGLGCLIRRRCGLTPNPDPNQAARLVV